MALFKDAHDYELEGLIHHDDGHYAKAYQCFRKALEKETVNPPEMAVLHLAMYYEEGICVPQDYYHAAILYKKIIAYNSMANYKLGCFYENGWGVPKKIDTAVDYYIRAYDRADKDSPSSWRPPYAALLRWKSKYPRISMYI